MKQLLILPILFFLLACTSSNEAIVEMDNDYRPSEGLTPVKEYGKWGYINSKGEKVIGCQYEWAGEFHEGLASILRDSHYGFIDAAGKVVIEPKYIHAESFSDGLSKVTLKEELMTPNGPELKEPYWKRTIGFLKQNGELAFISSYSDVNSFSDGRAGVNINGSACFLNKKGEVVIKTSGNYDMLLQFHEGVALVGNDNASWYIDTMGREIGRFDAWSCNDFSDRFAKVELNKKTFYIDKTGKQRIVPEIENIEFTYSDFSNGLALVSFEYKSGYIDTMGKLVIPFLPGFFGNVKEGLISFEENDRWGFMNKEGKVIIKAQFDYIDYDGFVNGLCWVRKNEQEGYINHKGEFVWIQKTGFAYEKLDPSKWDLDTLNTNMPLEDIAGYVDYPRKGEFNGVNELLLKVDTSDLTVFDDKYYAYKLYFINGSGKKASFSSLGKKIEIVCQAKNEYGKWQDIETRESSFCGNSYSKSLLKTGYYSVFAVPFFKGNLKTQFRFRLETEKGEIYSNIYEGYINPGQFVSSEPNSN